MLLDTGSQFALQGLSMIKIHFLTVRIQQIKNLLHENDLVLAGATLKTKRFKEIMVPFLITEQDFDLLILGINVQELIPSTQGMPDLLRNELSHCSKHQITEVLNVMRSFEIGDFPVKTIKSE